MRSSLRLINGIPWYYVVPLHLTALLKLAALSRATVTLCCTRCSASRWRSWQLAVESGWLITTRPPATDAELLQCMLLSESTVWECCTWV